MGASAGPYGRLEVLRLGRNDLGAAGAAALAALVGGKGLRELHLPGTGIGDAGAPTPPPAPALGVRVLGNAGALRRGRSGKPSCMGFKMPPVLH